MNAALDGGALPLYQLITMQELDIVIDEDNRTMNNISRSSCCHYLSAEVRRLPYKV